MSDVPEILPEDRDLAQRAVDSDLFNEPLGDAAFACPPKYDIVRTLGRGGGGEVYLAQDRNLDRLVALKYLSGAGPLELERFRREARYTARLKDAAIVRVFELDEFEGQHFIAMEYVDGGNLAQAELSALELVQKVRDVAVALGYAHAAGIVHRDIKPENILLDSDGRAYVTDFGLARDLAGGDRARLSQEGSIMGTPALMPPEQARGDIHSVDARSDIYSLGATLYTRLVGRPPFEGDTVIDILHAVLHDEPPFPRSLDPSVPRNLEAIVMKCLRKDRKDRYATTGDLVEDLDRFLGGQEVASESRWFQRLVQTLVGEEVEPEVAPPSRDENDPYWTTGMEVVREIAAWDADRYRISTDVTRTWPRLESIIERTDRILAAQPDSAWARFYRGAALYRRGRTGEALEEMERSVDRVPDRAGAWFELGRLYLELYLAEAREARKHLQASGVEMRLESAKARLDRAMLAIQRARDSAHDSPRWQLGHARAVRHLADEKVEECLAVCDEVLAADPDAEEVWKLRGDALELSGGDPFDSWRQAGEIRRSYHEVHLARGSAFLSRKRFGEACEALDRALAIHPELAEAKALRARARWSMASQAGAVIGVEELGELEQELRAATEFHPGDYELTLTLGEVLAARGRAEGSEPRIEAAIATLNSATNLEGCQNRVQWLIAHAMAERARVRVEQGGSRAEEFDAVLDFCKRDGDEVWQAEPWKSLVEGLEREQRGAAS